MNYFDFTTFLRKTQAVFSDGERKRSRHNHTLLKFFGICSSKKKLLNSGEKRVDF